ncbi:MAG: bacteriohemerythrin [Bacillales bacterium]|jgi:hemerythrin-like metal-binding protein|nr:bacteriohemerythrin [Bacillales bacterium]
MGKDWNSSFELGNKEIDEQHKSLVDEVERLSDRIEKGDIDKTQILQSLNFLVNYAVEHFRSEELISKQYNYPNRNYHNSVHDEFKKKVGEVAEQYTNLNDEKKSLELAKDICHFLSQWLQNHIKGDDFLLFQFIKSVQNKKS